MHGLDVLGATEAPVARLSWWENAAIVVGALASLATLVEISVRLKNGGR